MYCGGVIAHHSHELWCPYDNHYIFDNQIHARLGEPSVKKHDRFSPTYNITVKFWV